MPEIAGKRVPANRSMWFDRAVELLKDGEWHDYKEILTEVSKVVPPNIAYRHQEKRRRIANKGRDVGPRTRNKDEALLIAMGRADLVRVMLRANSFEIQRDEQGNRIRVRWVGLPLKANLSKEEIKARTAKGIETKRKRYTPEQRAEHSRKAYATRTAKIQAAAIAMVSDLPQHVYKTMIKKGSQWPDLVMGQLMTYEIKTPPAGRYVIVVPDHDGKPEHYIYASEEAMLVDWTDWTNT